MEIVPADVDTILAAGALFDYAPTPDWAEKFLGAEGHHLFFALGEDGEAIGFVSGVEMTHPDKGTEMFLYELEVHEDHRNRGIGRALVRALADLARDHGCYGMWVLTDADNPAALAAYSAAGGGPPDEQVMLSWDFERE